MIVVVSLPYVTAEQCFSLSDTDPFPLLRRFTVSHVPLFYVTDHHQSALQLYLSFGRLSNFVKSHFHQITNSSAALVKLRLFKLADHSITFKVILMTSCDILNVRFRFHLHRMSVKTPLILLITLLSSAHSDSTHFKYSHVLSDVKILIFARS